MLPLLHENPPAKEMISISLTSLSLGPHQHNLSFRPHNTAPPLILAVLNEKLGGGFCWFLVYCRH